MSYYSDPGLHLFVRQTEKEAGTHLQNVFLKNLYDAFCDLVKAV